MKQFADSYGICMLLVHHTRKQSAEDRFNMISGTNGLLGAADSAFLLLVLEGGLEEYVRGETIHGLED